MLEDILKFYNTTGHEVLKCGNSFFSFCFYIFLWGLLDAGLRQKLNKIMASEYFTTTPQIKAPGDVAAAVGNYTSFQAPLLGSIIPQVGFRVPMEGSSSEFEQEVHSYFHGSNN